MSHTNNELISEKYSPQRHAQKCQNITTNWDHSHFKTSKIINDQILNHCEKIIGGNILEVDGNLKQVETEPSFPTPIDLLHEYKTKFVRNGFINLQDLIE